MVSFFFNLIVQLFITLILVKVMFFRKGDGETSTAEDTSRWKTAADAMSLMETRLEQLTQRDMKHQERVWALEDLNRDLQNRLNKMAKDTRAAPRQLNFDDDEDDQDNAIPRNTK
jgi:hypothetical protein